MIYNISLFICSVCLLLLGHLMRASRWSIILSRYVKTSNTNYIVSILFGYIANLVFMFRIGDIFRAYIFSRTAHFDLAFTFSSLFLERIIDICILGVFCLIFFLCGVNLSGWLALKYLALFLIAFIIIISLYNKHSKKIILSLADIFNDDIKIFILKFFWYLENILTYLIKPEVYKLIIISIFMWLNYIGSLVILSYLLKINPLTITSQIYDYTVVDSFLMVNSYQDLIMLLYIVCPMLVMIFYIYLKKTNPFKIITTLQNASTVIFSGSKEYSPHCFFSRKEDYTDFLTHYYYGTINESFLNYVKKNKSTINLSEISGGSGAKTYLMQRKGEIFIRKIAFGEQINTLNHQYTWLYEQAKKLPVAKILNQTSGDGYYFYEMPYVDDAISMYHYVHTNSNSKNIYLLKDILASLEQNLYVQVQGTASQALITDYLQKKLFNNNAKISKAFATYWDQEDLFINGDKFHSPSKIFNELDLDKLLNVIKFKTLSRIHGDLTIENIITMRKGWYLIDSADQGNILSSKMLDYGKLFQSLHYGYEALNSTSNCNETNNGLFFSDNKSLQYTELFKFVCEYIVDNYDEDILMEVFLHEIICYARLLPYKIRLFPEKASIFFAVYVIIINKFYLRFKTTYYIK